MSGSVDDLIVAVLCEPKASIEKQAGEVAVSDSPDWEKLASELDAQADVDLDVHKIERVVVEDGVRMQKLAMAAILDTIDDPRCKPAIEKLANDAQEIVKSAFESPEPGSVGELAQITNSDGPAYVKHKVGKGRTLFEKMNNDSAPTAVAEGKK